MATAESTLGTGFIATGILAMTFFDVPLADFCAGALICGFGVAGRCGFDIQRALRKGDGISLSKIAGWAAAGFMGAPTASLAVDVLFKVMTGKEPDGWCGLLLLAIGFGGQELVGPLWVQFVQLLNKHFGFNIEVDNANGPNAKP